MMKVSTIVKISARCVMWVSIVVIGLLIGIGTIIVTYLQPEQLTGLVQGFANHYLKADVKIERVELTFWSTFPKLQLDVNGLNITSKALDSLTEDQRKQLPLDASELLSLKGFHGGINLLPLITGRFSLYDITLDSPKVNIVQATEDIGNYSIFPPSEPSTEPSTIPDITIKNFEILGTMPVSYYSALDSTRINITLSKTQLSQRDNPAYNLDIQGSTSATLGGITLHDLKLGLGGDIDWSYDNPYVISLNDFKIGLGNVMATTSLSLDMNEDLKVDRLKFSIPATPISDFIAVIPADIQGELARVDAKGSLGVEMQFTASYIPSKQLVPSVSAKIDIPGGSLNYDRLKLDDLNVAIEANIDGKNLNASTINLTRFTAKAQAIDVDITAKVTNLLLDPDVNGTFVGHLSASQLPKTLLDKLPVKVTGNLMADCDFHFRQSYLNPKSFHRVTLKGLADINELKLTSPMFGAGLYLHNIALNLGTTGDYKNEGVNVDSLFTASLNIDSIMFYAPGMKLGGSNWIAGIGALNRAQSMDTTQINPIGGGFKIGSLRLTSTSDSTDIALRNASIGGALRRFNNNARKPLLDAQIKAERASYRDPLNFAVIRDAEMMLKMHPSAPKMSRRAQQRSHELANIDDEVIYERMQKAMADPHSLTEVKEDNRLDLSVDGSLRTLLKQWDVTGSIKSRKIRVFTPLFPLKNRLTNLNMTFNTDEIKLRDTRLKCGESDFTINGTISNISHALTSRHDNALEIDFDIKSDNLDVNQMSAAMFAGSAYSEQAAMGPMTLGESEQAWDNAINEVAPIDSAAPFIVPSNIDATFNITGKNVKYSDFVFHDFVGSLMMYDGMINLHKLSASTEMGKANISALYTAPDVKNVTFALGMQLMNFNISKAMSMIPALDALTPILKDIKGIINGDFALTTRLDDKMNLDMPSLSASIKLSGDSLVLMDAKTFRTVSKWLLFRNKKKNMIDHMSMEMILDSGKMQVFPFIFDIDRYKLGVMGSNDLDLNFKYHVAVLKSPIPFRFGINLSGNPDKMKLRLGGAKFNEKNMAKVVAIADTTRINLVQEIENVFRRGARKGGVKSLQFKVPDFNSKQYQAPDTIAASDSLYFKQQGLIP